MTAGAGPPTTMRPTYGDRCWWMAPLSVSTTGLTTTSASTPLRCFHSSQRQTRSPSFKTEIFSVFQIRQVSRRAHEGAVVAMAAVAALLLGSPAEAHMGAGLAGGVAPGFNHPVAGFDHFLAMLSVGLWGAFLGRPLIYALPVIFPAVMVGGAVLGMLDAPLPPVEIGIALSVLVLGCCIVLSLKAPVWSACLI